MRRFFGVILVIVFALLVIGGPAHSARAAQSNAIHLSVDAAFSSHFREGYWIPLLISVSNDGPDVSGELRVVSGNTLGLTAGGYATPVELPTQSSKQLFLYVSLEVAAQQVQVELATTGGTVLQTVSAPVTRIDASDMQYAVITESPTGSVDLTTAHGSGSGFQADWRIENVPPIAQALGGLDALLLTDVDTGKFTTEQRRAIQDWVIGGGHLIVTGGPNWQKTRAGVDNLIPFSTIGTALLNSVAALTNYAGSPNDQLVGGAVIVAQGQLATGAKVLSAQDNTPLIVRGQFGQGIVDYLTADPGLEPFRSWTNRAAFWQSLLGTSGRKPGWALGVVSPGDAAQAANFVRGLRLPDIFQLAGFLAVYIILIGPLNYLLLRWLRRLEWAWFTIPIIIVLTSIAAYLTGFSLRGTQATINRMSLVQVWPGADRARVDGVVGVLAPRRAIYNVSAAEGMTLRTLNSDPYSATDSVSSVKINEGLTYSAESVPVDAGLSAAFATSGYIPAPALESSATVEITDNGRMAVRGKVRNTTNLALTDSLILIMGTTNQLGSLAPGEEKAFDFPVKPTDDASPAFNDVSVSAYSRSYSAYNNQRITTLRELLNSGYTPLITRSVNTSNAEQQEYKRRGTFLQGMISDADLNAGRGVDVYLAGWSTTSPVGIDLKDASFTTEDTTLYLFKLSSSVRAAQGTVQLTPGYMLWTPTGNTGQRAYTPYGLYLSSNEQATFQYNPVPAVQLATVSSLTLEVKRGTASSGATVSLWDWKAGQWVELGGQDSGRPTYTIDNPDDLARFVGPQNAVRVRVEPTISTASLERVDVTLEGQLQS